MADFDDELDINLRDLDDAGCRIIVLSALSLWPEISDGRDRQSWRSWLDSERVIDVATRFEVQVLGSDEPHGDELDVCDRALESVAPLVWATGLSDEIALTSSIDAGTLAELLPMPPERIEPFLDQLVLREEDEIALERERAEIWNWRLAAESIRRGARGRERQVILEAAISFALDEVDIEDFLADGVPVAKLDDDRLDALTVTSEERLRAFNWLCGLTEWELVHVPE
jgi:hypothetical protein